MPPRGIHKEWGYKGKYKTQKKFVPNKQGLNRSKRLRGTVDTGIERELLSLLPCWTKHPLTEERIVSYQERVEKGLPLFD